MVWWDQDKHIFVQMVSSVYGGIQVRSTSLSFNVFSLRGVLSICERLTPPTLIWLANSIIFTLMSAISLPRQSSLKMLLFKAIFIILTRALHNGGQQMGARISKMGGGGIWQFLIIGGGLVYVYNGYGPAIKQISQRSTPVTVATYAGELTWIRAGKLSG